MRFYDREAELESLRGIQRRVAAGRSQLTLVLGRRRMGKTTLVREFLREVPRALYFFVTRKRSEDLRAEFTEILAGEQPALREARLTWDGFLRACFEAAGERPLTVVFDEFQNFRYVDPSVFSILQKHWDTRHASAQIHLVAVGSLVSLMERIFTGAREPLARRATAQLRVQPFSPEVVATILGRAGRGGTRELVRHWTILGGCPKYYALAEDADLLGGDPLAIVDALVLGPNALLRDEGQALLVEEFGRAHTTAFAILRALASGRRGVAEIGQAIGMPVTALPKELRRLETEYQLIRREAPIGDEAGRLGRYRLTDPFLTFWFRYVYPFQSQLEAGRHDRVLAFVRRDLPTLEGWTLEALVRDRVARGDPGLTLPIEAEEVGGWWDRRGAELDVVALADRGRAGFFAECRLSASKVDRALLHGLRAKVEALPWRRRLRAVHHGVFTLGRVREAIRAEARALGIRLWEL